MNRLGIGKVPEILHKYNVLGFEILLELWWLVWHQENNFRSTLAETVMVSLLYKDEVWCEVANCPVGPGSCGGVQQTAYSETATNCTKHMIYHNLGWHSDIVANLSWPCSLEGCSFRLAREGRPFTFYGEKKFYDDLHLPGLLIVAKKQHNKTNASKVLALPRSGGKPFAAVQFDHIILKDTKEN